MKTNEKLDLIARLLAEVKHELAAQSDRNETPPANLADDATVFLSRAFASTPVLRDATDQKL